MDFIFILQLILIFALALSNLVRFTMEYLMECDDLTFYYGKATMMREHLRTLGDNVDEANLPTVLQLLVKNEKVLVQIEEDKRYCPREWFRQFGVVPGLHELKGCSKHA